MNEPGISSPSPAARLNSHEAVIRNTSQTGINNIIACDKNGFGQAGITTFANHFILFWKEGGDHIFYPLSTMGNIVRFCTHRFINVKYTCLNQSTGGLIIMIN